jgi:hypothetical protein
MLEAVHSLAYAPGEAVQASRSDSTLHNAGSVATHAKLESSALLADVSLLMLGQIPTAALPHQVPIALGHVGRANGAMMESVLQSS